jgi:hypothetical protein
MKTKEQILEYTENRTRELATAFKEERRLTNQWEPGNPFYENHYYTMSKHSEKLNEIKEILAFITGDDEAFYKIYNSIAN